MTDQEIIETIKKRVYDTLLMTDSDFNPSPTSRCYYEGEINALNFVLKMFTEGES